MANYVSVGEMQRAKVVRNVRTISRVGNGKGLTVGAAVELEWEGCIYPGEVVALLDHSLFGLVVTVLDCEGRTRRAAGELVCLTGVHRTKGKRREVTLDADTKSAKVEAAVRNTLGARSARAGGG